MTMRSNVKRARLRLIRRQNRIKLGQPLRRAREAREPRDLDDLDAPDDELIGVTD